MELKSAKTVQLGRNRYAVSGFIGAVQMRESRGNWQDIKPHLVRDSDGWHIEGAPYFAEMKDDGSRLFCPDRNERDKHIRIPVPALFRNLGRNVVQNPAKLDEEILPNQITLPTEWGEYRIIFSNTGMHFEVLFREAPPAAVFGRDSPRILLDAETLGFDIGELLKSSRGVGIPRPRLIAESQELAMSLEQERWLDWHFKDGQLELGFDFGDLTFPILLKNTTIDVQVDAGADDGFGWLPSYWNAGARLYIGNYGGSAVRCFYRFDGLSDFGGSTIETAYVQLNRYYGGGSGTATTKVQADDQASPDAPENTSELFAITPTSNGIDWDGVDQAGWAQSPSIVDVIQELADSYGSITVVQIIHDDDGGSTIWEKHSYDTNPSYAPKLYIEFSTGPTVYQVSVSEGLKAGDTPSETMTASPVLTEGLKSGDALSEIGQFLASLSEGIKLGDTEAIELLGIIYLALTDGLKLGEENIESMLSSPSLMEGLKAGDIEIIAALISSLEGLKIGDSNSEAMKAYPEITEGITLGEAITEIMTAGPALTEGAKIGDVELESMLASLQLVDGTRLGDLPLASMTAGMQLTEGIKLGDAEAIILATIGRMLTMMVVTARHRNIEVTPTTYRILKAITSLYRHIFTHTGG